MDFLWWLFCIYPWTPPYPSPPPPQKKPHLCLKTEAVPRDDPGGYLCYYLKLLAFRQQAAQHALNLQRASRRRRGRGLLISLSVSAALTFRAKRLGEPGAGTTNTDPHRGWSFRNRGLHAHWSRGRRLLLFPKKLLIRLLPLLNRSRGNKLFGWQDLIFEFDAGSLKWEIFGHVEGKKLILSIPQDIQVMALR